VKLLLSAAVLVLGAAAYGQQYGHVTITADSFVTRFAPLGQYVEQGLGLSDTTVAVESICVSYPGRDAPERIRNFIRFAYSNWGTTHVLLGGDVEIVPCRRAFVDATEFDPLLLDTIPADLYYSDLDGDWDKDGDGLFGEPEDSCDLYPDIFVGRIPATTTAEATLLVGKFLVYTADPDAAYLRNVLLSGFDIFEGIYCESTMEFYDSTYVPAGMRPCTKVYDSHDGNHELAVRNAVNQGQHVWVHADHSAYFGMGMGYMNHGYVMYRDELARFTNAGKYTIMTSLGCETGEYDTADCASEVFMLNANGGGVAVASNSRYGLSSGNNPQRGYSFMLVEGFVRGMFSDPQQGSLEAITSAWTGAVPLAHVNSAYRWCLVEWNLLGEAAMPVWIPAGTGIEEGHKPQATSSKLGPTIVRGVLNLPRGSSTSSSPSWLLDITGRKVMEPKAGANDVSRLAPGVYFIGAATGGRMPVRILVCK